MKGNGKRGVGWMALTIVIVLVEVVVVIKAIQWLLDGGKLAALTLAPIAFAFYGWIGLSAWRRTAGDQPEATPEAD